MELSTGAALEQLCLLISSMKGRGKDFHGSPYLVSDLSWAPGWIVLQLGLRETEHPAPVNSPQPV